ncbi:MAG: general secretion pathway protein C [Pseudohongiellaceae bacterium]|jgi:general secretion pathway protein C
MLLSRLPLMCALVLLAVLAGSIYWQTSSFLKPDMSDASLKMSKHISSPINNNLKQTHNIARFKLFGDAKLTSAKIVTANENLPKTNLKLTLTGVLVSPTQKGAGALILGPDRQTQHYRVNDELPGGATLQQVFSDRVIVNRAGRLENLYFVEKKSLGIEHFTVNNNPQTPQQSMQVRGGDISTSHNTERSSARSQSIRNRLSKLKKRIIQNKQ